MSETNAGHLFGRLEARLQDGLKRSIAQPEIKPKLAMMNDRTKQQALHNQVREALQ